MNETRDAHANYYLKMAREEEPELSGPLQGQWLVRFDAELDNLRAAPGWFLQRGQIEEELRLAIALFWFWYRRGHWNEERRWLEEGLARGDAVAEAVRGTALGRLGRLAFEQGDYERATTQLVEALQLLQEVGDRLVSRSRRHPGHSRNPHQSRVQCGASGEAGRGAQPK